MNLVQQYMMSQRLVNQLAKEWMFIFKDKTTKATKAPSIMIEIWQKIWLPHNDYRQIHLTPTLIVGWRESTATWNITKTTNHVDADSIFMVLYWSIQLCVQAAMIDLIEDAEHVLFNSSRLYFEIEFEDTPFRNGNRNVQYHTAFIRFTRKLRANYVKLVLLELFAV